MNPNTVSRKLLMLPQFTHTAIFTSLLAAATLVCAEDVLKEHLIKQRTKGSLTYYSGLVTVSGKIERRTDYASTEILEDQLCMFPNKVSAKLIPREPDDSRIPWFCFSNRIAAMKQLQVPNQKPKDSCGFHLEATVQVTEYTVNRAESEVFDAARLVQVVSRGPTRNLACNE